MEKDKIILKDGTELQIKQGGNTGEATMVFESLAEFTDVMKKMTPLNLEQYQVQNSNGFVSDNPENKECLFAGLRLTWNDAGNITGVVATFQLTNVDMVAKAIKELKAGQVQQNVEITNVQVGLAEMYESVEV